MVSEMFRSMEEKSGSAFIFQEELVEEIARKLGKTQGDVERAIYLGCVATGSRSMEMSVLVYEFLVSLDDVRKGE